MAKQKRSRLAIAAIVMACLLSLLLEQREPPLGGASEPITLCLSQLLRC